MTQPWQHRAKAPQDEVLDLIYAFPAIFRRFDRLKHAHNKEFVASGLKEIVFRCAELEKLLKARYERFEKLISGPLYWPSLSTLHSDLDDSKAGKVFPISFCFPNFSVALIVTNYWCGMMLVHYQLMFTHRKLEAITQFTPWSGNVTDSLLPSNITVQSKAHADQWHATIKKICQATEYFLNDDMGAYGAMTALTQLSGCMSCLLDDLPVTWGREIAWMSEVMTRVKSKYDLHVRHFTNKEGT
jgi:hypothetical protein